MHAILSFSSRRATRNPRENQDIMIEPSNPPTSSTYPSALRTTTIPPSARTLALGWLVLGITALAIAGVFAILLVLARTPGLSALFPTTDFFRTALIVHVDQSVLIWFLAFGGVLWSLGEREITFLHRLALVFATLGCLAVALTPFAGFSEPFLNNYVPVLRHPLFFGGIFLFATGILFQALLALRQTTTHTDWIRPDRLAALTAAVATLTALLALTWTWIHLTRWEGQAYFEFLFWGGGHTIQFAYSQLMVAAWLGLAAGLGITLRVSIRALQGLLILGVLPILIVPVLYSLYAVDSPQAHSAFMTLMRHGGGLAAIPIGIIVFYGLVKQRGELSSDERPLYAALTASLLLFSVGGVLGWVISGLNTIIPAHYHGSIVGVTLALMGLSYHLLPLLGFSPPPSHLATIQPWVYAVGQLLHVGGLAASGAMGIQRKTAGAAQGLDTLSAKVAMGVMGLGGLLAIIGGILFVVAVVYALRHPRAPRW
ncbi:conserved membrane hypothetical protein [Gammaproteobacteria bacterium]